MKFTKLMFFSLVLIGASFSQASDALKMMTWDQFQDLNPDYANKTDYDQYVAKWQKDNPVAQQVKKPVTDSVLRRLLFPNGLSSSPAVTSVEPPAGTGSAPAPSVVMPAADDWDEAKRFGDEDFQQLVAALSKGGASTAPAPSVVAPVEDFDDYSAWYYGSQSMPDVANPVLAAKAVATREEDWDPFSTGDTDLFAGLTVYPPSSAPASSLAIGDDLNNLVYLEHKLFNDNYDQLISLSRAQKLALLQSKADEEAAQKSLLAELAATLQSRGGRYSPATNSSGDGGASVASGDFDFGDWGDSADVFGNFEGANGDGASALAIDTDNVVHVEATLYNSKTDPVDYATLLAHDLAWKQAKLGSV